MRFTRARLLGAAVLLFCLAGFVVHPAGASSPGSGTITKSKRSVKWTGGPFTISDPVPDPLELYDPSCHTSSSCDHFALKMTLGDKAKLLIKITTPRANPPGGQQPVEGDDYDLYVYDPNGVLISGEAGATAKGNEQVIITHAKRFNGKAYDISVRPWFVTPGSTYQGSVTALNVGR
jgi:hypothetical protein